MFEAVNSVISNAPMLRGNAEQMAVARSFAANPDRVQEVPMAPYISPYIHVDVKYNEAVLQLRDSDTGAVESQIPSEERLVQIREAEERRQLNKLKQGVDIQPGADIIPQQVASETDSPKVETATGSAGVKVNARQIAAFEAGAQTAHTGESGTVSVEA